ncbi:hypothetical protein BT96DRAFT_994277 [Gymnopus androsaceus JB14]|uniref:ARID domain-containing protein n=1 Tax=Gymnopus androsaceus JB14 TaxID=1447944 RepID=A0A6A4HQ64_9AGAR|nr:hypothetical protein BT96DRAFT_994277 [Gymnopus androsaceus JB14]
MPPKRSPSPSDASPRKRTKRSPLPNPSPSSPPSPHSVAPDASLPVPISTVSPAPWQTATSAEIDEALKSIFQLGGQFVVDVSDDQWRGIAKQLNSCVRCEGKSELCSAAGGTELRAHKRCSLGIAYRYCLFANRFHAPLSWARQEFESRMTRLSPRSYNSYHQSAPFFTSLEEAIRHAARPTGPPPPSADRVGPPGHGCIVKSMNPQSSPPRSHRSVSPLGYSSWSYYLYPTSHAQRPAPPNRSPSPPIPLRVGDVVIPPGSDLARELAAFEATEAQVEAASHARFFKQQEDACIAAAKTKHCLEAEQQRKEKQAVKTHWKDDMREREQAEKDARRRQKKSQREQAEKDAHCQQKTLAAQQQQHRQVPSSSLRDLDSQVTRARPSAPSPPPIRNSPCLSPAEHTSIPPEFSPLSAPPTLFLNIRLPFLVGLGLLPGFTSAPVWMEMLIAGLMLPLRLVVTLLLRTFGTHMVTAIVWTFPIWFPQMPILQNNDVGALQQELLDMQRCLNSAQLDLETERACNRMSVVQTQHLEAQLADLPRLNSEQEHMLKNRQV